MTDKATPFSSIGLCFSGGGYRAAAFSLGVLSYLQRIKYNDIPLLKQVEALSTVSGGTITGAYFARCVYSKVDFNSFYNTPYKFLNEDKLLERALDKLEDTKLWEKLHKKQSLINAFALAYEEMLQTGKFELLANNNDVELKDVCFNATEFAYGLAFRFQNSGTFSNEPLENNYLNRLKDQIRISDAIASSSCFPFGFEPMIFPDDYFVDHSSDDYRVMKQSEKYRDGIGIMDGGIVNNQGIGSMVLIDKRRIKRKESPLSELIVCDVGSYFMDQWMQADSATGNGKPGRTINHLIGRILKFLKFKWYYFITLIFGVLLVIVNSMNLISGVSWSALYVVGGFLIGVGLLLMIFGSLTSLVRMGLGIFIRNFYRKNIPKELIDDVATFKKLDIGLVKRMLVDRATSAVTMISEVFLNQIRRLNYKLLYEKKEYRERSITSTVYQLNGLSKTLGNDIDVNTKIQPAPSDELMASSMIASQMPTTLWWDQADRNVNRLENLIACGQFTTCYNLMDYILGLKKKGNTDSGLDDLYKDLHKDWKVLNDDPRKFVQEKTKT
jgi:hypothetical protein